MKYALIIGLFATLSACKSTQSTSGIDHPEEVRYKLFIEEEDHLAQTPAELKLELIPTQSGFFRVSTIEGPGVALIDSLLLSENGLPIYHVFKRGRTKYKMNYRKDEAFSVIQGDTFQIPLDYEYVYDIAQVDLVLRGIDTLGNVQEVAFMLPENSDVKFLEIAEIRRDTIGSDWYAQDSLPVVHRYAVGPGTVYEGWYADDQVLPIKWRVTSNGSTYVYLRIPELIMEQRKEGSSQDDQQ